MPLARAIRGGWWASAFTGLFPRKWHFDEKSMTRFRPAQKAWQAEGLAAAGKPANRGPMLTGDSQQCGMAKTGEAIAVHLEDANGRQEQRSGRNLAKHDRRDGEGIQLLCQPGDGVAGIQQGREPGRWRYRGRAKAARRSHGEISRQHESAEPGADGRHGRAVAVDRRAVERDQGAAAAGPQ